MDASKKIGPDDPEHKDLEDAALSGMMILLVELGFLGVEIRKPQFGQAINRAMDKISKKHFRRQA